MAVTAAQVQKDRRIVDQPIRGMKKQHRVSGDYTTTTSGTLSTTAFTGVADAGMLVAKTGSETGRYTVQVWEGFKRIAAWGASLVGADDTVMTDAKGIHAELRDIDIGAGAKDGTVEVQFSKNTDMSDAEVMDGSIIKLWFDLEY